MILEQIQNPDDIKKLNGDELKTLAQEIREFLIDKISVTGGHLASNLGVVELTIALFLSFHLPEDKIVWDVGHQAYTHKILSGRREMFDDLRQYGGISGFPKRKESPYDAFDTGHSSTSISAGLGLAQGRDILGENHYVVSVIGDGALTGGMAYEALNNAARMNRNFIIVLNDNNMSISENVGGMSKYLNGIRTGEGYNGLKRMVNSGLEKIPVVGKPLIDKITRTKNGIKQLLIPGMLFENMGITYLGPVNGHDIRALQKVFREAKKLDHAVLVHVLTKKGKGYPPAEKNPARFHGISPFDVKTGKLKAEKKYPDYTDMFCQEDLSAGRGGSPHRGGDGGHARRDGAQGVCPAVPEPLFRRGHRRGARGDLRRRDGCRRAAPGGGGLLLLPAERIRPGRPRRLPPGPAGALLHRPGGAGGERRGDPPGDLRLFLPDVRAQHDGHGPQKSVGAPGYAGFCHDLRAARWPSATPEGRRTGG